ncbi:MAG UNVERIFIED_CONTAM: tetratricopeptide repeat protein [Planctomycetaceae bacterium]|jgi:tetratricopeptide (TPR) repeat protein
MSRSRDFSIAKLRKNLLLRWATQRRRFEAFAKSFGRFTHELFKLRESEVSVSRDDRRRMPARLSYINPVFWVVQSVMLMIRYVQSRQYGNMLRGVPALGGLCFPVVLSLWFAPSFDQELQQTSNRLSRALDADDLTLADFHARKMCALVPDDSSAWMRLAVVRDLQGKPADAERIAIEKGVQRGYVPAAEWLADRRFAAVVGNSEADATLEKELVDGLKWIIERRPEDVRANFMLGTYLLYRSQLLEARPVLKHVVSLQKGNFPEALYSLAVVEAQLGEEEASRTAAGLAADGFLKRDTLKEFQVEAFMQLIRSLLIARRETEAIQLIQQKFKEVPAYEQQFRQLTGEVLAAWSTRLRTSAGRTSEDIQQALAAVSQAVIAAPTSPAVTKELVALAGVSEISDETLDEHLTKALDAGVSPGVIHFIQGTRCLSRNPPDIEAGLQHLRIADTHNPGMPGLLNNMADAIVESETPNLPQALNLVEQALKMLPNQPHVHDTRGKIYLRMGEPLKAISDLEIALQAAELRPTAHAKLAEAYLLLGDQRQHAYHKAMVDSLRKTMQKRLERNTP